MAGAAAVVLGSAAAEVQAEAAGEVPALDGIVDTEAVGEVMAIHTGVKDTAWSLTAATAMAMGTTAAAMVDRPPTRSASPVTVREEATERGTEREIGVEIGMVIGRGGQVLITVGTAIAVRVEIGTESAIGRGTGIGIGAIGGIGIVRGIGVGTGIGKRIGIEKGRGRGIEIGRREGTMIGIASATEIDGDKSRRRQPAKVGTGGSNCTDTYQKGMHSTTLHTSRCVNQFNTSYREGSSDVYGKSRSFGNCAFLLVFGILHDLGPKSI